MDSIQVIATGDGSHSLLNTALQETYHSRHGAVQESSHVFIDHGLRVVQAIQPRKEIRLLEVGFGTGLNALLTFMESQRNHLPVVYESWELHPLAPEIVQQLNYGAMLGDPMAFEAIHQVPWEINTALSPEFVLFKHKGNVLADEFKGMFDLIYYDAFAPSKQPELWSLEMLKKVTDQLGPGGVWVTYCAKGQVKRDLASLGLMVETLPGPPGKKEMVRATRRID